MNTHTVSFEGVNGCNAAVHGASKVSIIKPKIIAPCFVALNYDYPIFTSSNVLNVGSGAVSLIGSDTYQACKDKEGLCGDTAVVPNDVTNALCVDVVSTAGIDKLYANDLIVHEPNVNTVVDSQVGAPSVARITDCRFDESKDIACSLTEGTEVVGNKASGTPAMGRELCYLALAKDMSVDPGSLARMTFQTLPIEVLQVDVVSVVPQVNALIEEASWVTNAETDPLTILHVPQHSSSGCVKVNKKMTASFEGEEDCTTKVVDHSSECETVNSTTAGDKGVTSVWGVESGSIYSGKVCPQVTDDENTSKFTAVKSRESCVKKGTIEEQVCKQSIDVSHPGMTSAASGHVDGSALGVANLIVNIACLVSQATKIKFGQRSALGVPSTRPKDYAIAPLDRVTNSNLDVEQSVETVSQLVAIVKVPGTEFKAGTSLHLISGLGKGLDADTAEEVM